jgi:hypothetical protein
VRKVVVATDPADVDVAGAVVIVSGPGLAHRVRVRGGWPVVARPDALPVRGDAAGEVRADGAFAYGDPSVAAGVMGEVGRVTAPGGVVVAAAQIDPGPDVPGRPVSADELARLGPGTPVVESFHDRRCRKDWLRLRWRVPAAR